MDEVMQTEAGLAVELRVLHGPQAGSRLLLEPGEYLLGASDDCAIILAGPRIAAEHAQISFDGESLWIAPMQGEVVDSQGNEIRGESLLTLGQPLEMGGIWIAVDAVDAPWQSAEALSPLPRRQSSALNEDDEDEEGVGADPQTPDDTGFKDEEAYPEAEAGKEAAAGTEAADDASGLAPIMGEARELNSATAPGKRRKGWVIGLMALGLSCMLLLLGGLMWAVRDSQPPPAVAPSPEAATPKKKVPPPALTALLERYGKQLEAREDGGEWILEGILPNAAALASLNEEVAALEPRPQLKVLTDEELLTAASKFLAGRNNAGSAVLALESRGGGRLRLVGAATTLEQVNEAIAALRTAVPGLRQIDNAVLLPPALRKRFLEKLASAGLSAKIKVLAEEPELQLQGSLSNDEIRLWEALLLDFTRQYGNVLAINASIGRARAPMPVDVQVIVGGRTPYIVTAGGELVNMGGDVNGHTLSAVSNAEVVFEGSKRLRMGR